MLQIYGSTVHLLLRQCVCECVRVVVCVCVVLTYLQVVLRVPVRVKDDAGVCGCEVDPQAASSRAQEENEAFRFGLTEAVDGCLPQVPANAAIYPLIQVPARSKENTHDARRKQ